MAWPTLYDLIPCFPARGPSFLVFVGQLRVLATPRLFFWIPVCSFMSHPWSNAKHLAPFIGPRVRELKCDRHFGPPAVADGFRGAENIGDGESSSAILLILWPCLESRSGPRCSCCCSPSHSFLSFLVFLFLLLFLLLLLLVAFVVSVVLRDVAVVVVGVVVGFARPICDVQKQRRKQQTSTEVAEVGNHKEELRSSSDPHQLAFYLT